MVQFAIVHESGCSRADEGIGRRRALTARTVTLIQRFDPALWACPGLSGQVNRGHPRGDQ